MKKFSVACCAFLFVLAARIQLCAANLSISPVALFPMDDQVAAFPFERWDQGFYFDQTSSSYDDAIMLVALNLPNGVTLNRLTIFVTRNTADGDIYITVYLMRHELATGATKTMATIYTWGLPASATRKSLSTTALSYPTINNSKYTYSMWVGFSRPVSALKFHGAKLSW